MKHSSPVNRFYSLDVLRGVAALSVVLWHWQHFFFIGATPGPFDLARLPFSRFLSPLYSHGWLAVDLFFMLSGFIFYYLYSQRVADENYSARHFALLRLSRLYPLHLATLLFVAVVQYGLMDASGQYFVYPSNDVYHFLLNIFFVSSWGLERAYSFNGPIWSVSVEVLLYALFFLSCRYLPRRTFVIFCISTLGFLLVQKFYAPVGRGIGAFFLGGGIYSAYQAIANSRYTKFWARAVAALLIAAAGMTAALVIFKPDSVFLAQINSWFVVVIFPLTILLLALLQTTSWTLGKNFAFLGDISYSSYLLHFPLQLLCSILFLQFGVGQQLYYAPWFMALFFAVLIALCLISFHCFELPVQQRLRGRYSKAVY